MNRKIYQAKAMGQIIGLMLYDMHQLNVCIYQGECRFDDYKMLPPAVNGFIEASISWVLNKRKILDLFSVSCRFDHFEQAFDVFQNISN